MLSKGNGQCFTARLSCSSVSIHPPFIRCTPFYDVTEIHVHVKHELHFYNLHNFGFNFGCQLEELMIFVAFQNSLKCFSS
ncbi:hypothetical protein T06_884 [Trichinella sp. T6]|nr:hypothetical protein T06_884 [Trichinella sp. T6]